MEKTTIVSKTYILNTEVELVAESNGTKLYTDKKNKKFIYVVDIIGNVIAIINSNSPDIIDIDESIYKK